MLVERTVENIAGEPPHNWLCPVQIDNSFLYRKREPCLQRIEAVGSHCVPNCDRRLMKEEGCGAIAAAIILNLGTVLSEYFADESFHINRRSDRATNGLELSRNFGRI